MMPHHTRIKICGVRDPGIASAVSPIVDYVGIVRFARSPRHARLQRAKEVFRAVTGSCATVVLMVEPSDAEVGEVVEFLQPDCIQLHGSESVSRCRDIRHRFGCSIIKAVSVGAAIDIERAMAYRDVCHQVIVDAATTPGKMPGGEGESFDWNLLRGHSAAGSLMLAGGLNAANVATALRASGVGGVDVSSGVESVIGVKSVELIQEFAAVIAEYDRNAEKNQVASAAPAPATAPTIAPPTAPPNV